MSKKRSTQPLVQALAIYEAGEPARRKAWDDLVDSEPADFVAAVDACQAADKAALDKVREVFAELTNDRNSHDNAMLVDIDFMRQCAAQGEI